MQRFLTGLAATALVLGLISPINAAAPASDANKKTVYDESADATKDLAAAVALAAGEHKRVLLQIGGNWCGWCIKLDELLNSNLELKRLMNAEYEVVHVDIGRGDKHQALLKECGIRPQGYPYLAVLDAQNKLVTQQETSSLEDGPKHDPKKVEAFLTKWKAEPVDANKVFADALARAGAADKRVFVRFGSPTCGWCHKLDAVVRQPAVAEALGAEFEVVKIDTARMTGGDALLDKYQKSGGIPWHAVFTADGKVQHTSEIKSRGNIGFPTEPHELEHLMTMLGDGRRHMNDAQLATVRDAFTTAAAAAKQAMEARQRPAASAS